MCPLYAIKWFNVGNSDTHHAVNREQRRQSSKQDLLIWVWLLSLGATLTEAAPALAGSHKSQPVAVRDGKPDTKSGADNSSKADIGASAKGKGTDVTAAPKNTLANVSEAAKGKKARAAEIKIMKVGVAETSKTESNNGETTAAVKPPPAPRPNPETVARLTRLGAMSVGLPNTGVLVNGVRMPDGEDWVLSVPSHGYGTEETVRQLGQCITATRAAFPDSPRVMLGSLSAASGGKLPPHKSHRTGRDADVYFFRKPGAQWSKAATRQDIDLPRTWALLRCFVTKTDVDMVLIDRKVQVWLQTYALSIGEPPEWIDELFHDKPHTKSALVRHVPGHVAHMHVRFVSAHARKLGAKHYQELVGAGLLRERVEEVRHTVGKGDTLLGLAKRYKISVGEIQSLNRIKGSVIRLGQVLLVKQGVPIEGVDAPVYGHGRVLPPEPCEPGPKACHAGLALVNRSQIGVLVGELAPEDAALLSASLR